MQHFSWLEKANLFARSLVFSIVTTVTALVWSMVCIMSFPFPFKVRGKLVTMWTDFEIRMLKMICRMDYKLEGAENIPKDRNGIVLSKHQSTWETFFLPGLFNGPAIILKKELFWLPFFGWALWTFSPIAINRSKTSTAMEQIAKQGTQFLQMGRWVLVFPEGTRVASGHVGRYRLGGARLAVATGYPVIPIAHNAGRFWPKRKFLKIPGTIRVVVGPLIDPKGKTPEQVLDIAKSWIEETMIKIGG